MAFYVVIFEVEPWNGLSVSLLPHQHPRIRYKFHTAQFLLCADFLSGTENSLKTNYYLTYNQCRLESPRNRSAHNVQAIKFDSKTLSFLPLQGSTTRIVYLWSQHGEGCGWRPPFKVLIVFRHAVFYWPGVSTMFHQLWLECKIGDNHLRRWSRSLLLPTFPYCWDHSPWKFLTFSLSVLLKAR